VVVCVVLTLLLLVVIIAYIVWRINRSSMSVVDVIKRPVSLHGKPAVRVGSSKLPALSAGQGYSISFWVYLTAYNPTALPQLLLMRQGNGASSGNAVVANASPVVFMSGTANKMHICMRTNAPAVALSAASTSGGSLLEMLAPGNKTRLCASIDYVPLQRWVNVVLSVQDNLLNVFQDGSLYTVASLDTLASPRPMFATSSGDMVVGNVGSSVSADLNGYVAKVQAFTYALSPRAARDIYAAGPMSGTAVMSKLGMPDYGFRSPMYRLDQADEQK
jgi:hypothetical protein